MILSGWCFQKDGYGCITEDKKRDWKPRYLSVNLKQQTNVHVDLF